MLSEEEWGSVVEHGDVIKPYMDVKLQQSPEEYRHFVKKLYDVGMLRFTCSPQDLVTPFFVSKKDGRLRLILDCRGVITVDSGLHQLCRWQQAIHGHTFSFPETRLCSLHNQT